MVRSRYFKVDVTHISGARSGFWMRPQVGDTVLTAAQRTIDSDETLAKVLGTAFLRGAVVYDGEHVIARLSAVEFGVNND